MNIQFRMKNIATHFSFKPHLPITVQTTPKILSLAAAASSSSSFSSSSSSSFSSSSSIQLSESNIYKVEFKTLEGCKLGISRYPDFDYNGQGGMGNGTADKSIAEDQSLSVRFDPTELYIPPLMSSTTRFLGLPLPPFLKIDITPQIFQGTINTQSGQVELEFIASFCFSIGSVYRAPPLLVVTVLTTEESTGEMRSGTGTRLDGKGNCKLVGVARVEPIDDLFINTFLQLPTECLAEMSAVISFSEI